MDPEAATTGPLDVSVIIPTKNRPDRLRTCLVALQQQDFPRTRFEVIVVDDGSDTPLDVVVDPFRPHLDLTLLRQKNSGPARARNAGAAAARGRLLAFTDDDCQPEPTWLHVLRASHESHPSMLLGGYSLNGLPQNLYSTASQLLIDYLYDYHSSAARVSAGGPTAPPFFTSNNFALSADLFRKVGGFDETFPLAAGEDREFCDRWQAHGFRLKNLSEAVIRHSHALSPRKFWRQHMNYGRGAFHLRQARSAHGRPPVTREPLSFYLRLILFPLTAGEKRPLRLVGLMLASQVANLLGFLLERQRSVVHRP